MVSKLLKWSLVFCAVGFFGNQISCSSAEGVTVTLSRTSVGETSTNTGEIGSSVTITIEGLELNSDLSVLDEDTHYETSDLPDGLTIVLTRTSATEMTLTFSGNATDHAVADNTTFRVDVLKEVIDEEQQFLFKEIAFSFSLDIEFIPTNDVMITPSATEFAERTDNDGVIDETLTLDLSGDDFSISSGPFTETEEYDIVGTIPDNLEVQLFLLSATSTLVRFLGAAENHEDSDSFSFTVTFNESAFAGGIKPNDGSANLEFDVNFDPSDVMVLYVTDEATLYDGNQGGRAGIDALCVADKPAGVSQANVRAFVSIDSNDEILDMPSNYNVPTSGTFVETPTGLKIADSWADLLDGSIDVALNDVTSGLSFNSGFWSGSNSDGSLSTNHCTNWTSASNLVQGRTGSESSTGATWLASFPDLCNTMRQFLCLAFD